MKGQTTPNDKERQERRERFRNHRKWILNNLLEDFSWKKLSAEEKKGRFIRDGLIVLMSALSILMYWVCFLNSSIPVTASVLIFLFYLVPIAVITILYGWFGGVLCFTPIFIVSTLLSPSNAYLPFFHLVAIYLYHHIRKKDRCRTVPGTLLHGLLSGMILSGFYYLIFVLVTAESFSEATVASLLLHITNIVPQSVMICFFLYWFTHRCGDSVKQRLGCYHEKIEAIGKQIRDNVRNGYRSVSAGIFALLLIEAVFMGVAAAFFANSLVPWMLESDRAQRMEEMAVSQGMSDGREDAGRDDRQTEEDEQSKSPEKPEREEESAPLDPWRNGQGLPPMITGDFSLAFETARAHAPMERFTFDDRGIAFDCKLIMMLLCVIHPIVLISNYVGQKLIANPISEITGIMNGFGDDAEQRLVIEKKLSEYEIHSEDELEALYVVMTRMVGELNSYIEDMKREQQLREDLRVAQAASEAKSTFLSNMSHEIRTPINAVLGLDEMILRESGEETIRKYAVDIRNAGKSLLSLINDLLDFSRIEAGKMEIIEAEYELSSTVNDLINMVSTKAGDKGLELSVDVSSDIPHVLYGDEIRIKQCILNILNNAVKYTQKGSVTMYLSGKKLSDEEICLCVRVVDTGIGIKEEDLTKLYSPFERIEESRNRTIEGTGLGMSIVKQLLDMMGSQLIVKSVYGKGSDFSFEVKQRVVNWEPIGDFNSTYLASIQSAMHYRESFIAPEARLLVVDDTPMNLTVIQGLLKPTRVQVDTATSGAECLDMVRKASYDIIFMDQRMPEMDGVETLHALQAMPAEENLCSKAPAVCLTANVIAGARERFLKEGFTDYLSKPIDAGKLEQMIARLLPPEKVLPPEEAEKASNETDAEKEETESDFVKALSQAEGIDAQAALKNCMTEEILQGAVHDFAVSLKTEPDKIEKLWKEGDLRDYTIAVHALKSSARLIGALKLSSLAAELEVAGDAGDNDRIDRDTPELLFLYRGFCDKLKGVCDPADVSDGADDGREVIDPARLAEAYGAIREAVTAFDYDTADEILKMIKDYRIPEQDADKYERIRDLVTRLDRDALLEEL